MQTFLPFPDYERSARCLDNKRLGKQRVEVLQILNVLKKGQGGWVNHPAVRMWRGHEGALAEYGVAICDEWKRRGFKDTIRRRLRRRRFIAGSYRKPRWFGDKAFHASHRSNLKRKDAHHYAMFKERPDLEYVWPV